MMSNISSIPPVQLILKGKDALWLMNAVIHGIIGDQHDYRYKHAVGTLEECVKKLGRDKGTDLFIDHLRQEYGQNSVPQFAALLIRHVATSLAVSTPQGEETPPPS